MNTQTLNPPADQVRGTAILHRIINTHYQNLNQMEQQTTPATPEQKQQHLQELKIRLTKISQAIVDAKLTCFERPHLIVYNTFLKEINEQVQELAKLLPIEEKLT